MADQCQRTAHDCRIAKRDQQLRSFGAERLAQLHHDRFITTTTGRVVSHRRAAITATITPDHGRLGVASWRERSAIRVRTPARPCPHQRAHTIKHRGNESRAEFCNTPAHSS